MVDLTFFEFTIYGILQFFLKRTIKNFEFSLVHAVYIISESIIH